MSEVERREHRREDRDDRRDHRRSRDSESRRSRSRDRGKDDRRDDDRDRSRERRSSRRSRSPRRRRSRSRSASPAYDPERPRRRPTWFDIPPIGGGPPPLSSLPGAVQVISDTSIPIMPAGSVFGGAASQQATRHARRIYVGGLPPSATEDGVASFFSNALAAVGGTVAGPGSCVVNVYINFEKKFAFVELRTVEETSNAMALDGIMYEGVTVRIRRPADYQAAAALSLGPSQPNPNLNLMAIGLDKKAQEAAAAAVAAAAAPPSALPAQPLPPENRGSDRIFVGGLPYYLTEEHIRELLSSFGVIRQLDIVRDRETQQFKGYCFVVFEEQPMAEMAMAGLHGMKMGDRALTVKPANDNSRNNDGGGGAVTMVAPPRVVRLLEAVTPDELANDEEYADIMEDMREECGKYGTVLQVHIPRPGPPDAPAVPGLGKVLIEFAEPSAAIAARNAMHGRRFSGRTVVATLLTDDDYKLMKWD
ncbi:hypothetical protein ACKKBF_B35235 [Auxenochlorella protothecoides x Auxenochlorella symbiontica]|uniref:RRM domain-containing protein n=1 Tax=Auxenochlorella protothecoides TaxID=3075 RepID=A0A1D1ZTA5_AUXPR